MFAGGVAWASDIHWSYGGDTGPEYWGDLSPEFATCSSGTEQSPIDIASAAPLNPADLVFSYEPSALTVVNNGHTIQANYDPGSTFEVDGLSYQLLQFHFHNPSEHTVDSSATPMELHLVHKNDRGELAVVGVFLIEGAENAALAPVFANMPDEEGEPVAVDGISVDAAGVLPADQTYWRYNGSLTTPPCSEKVKWFVMTDPVEVSAEQLAAYTELYSGNARPVQPINEREFIVGSVPSTMPTTGVTLGDSANIVVVVVGTLLALVVLAGHSARHRRQA
ncbi:MAG: carbonic anhydrase family protein [Caldilineaceae bacterium]|nr:carbonic anhydrase family protein [Caldilineaceae bacterium]